MSVFMSLNAIASINLLLNYPMHKCLLQTWKLLLSIKVPELFNAIIKINLISNAFDIFIFYDNAHELFLLF